MATEKTPDQIIVTVNEIGPDQENVLLASLVTDAGEMLTVPLHLLPSGSKIGDVLALTFTQEPDKRQRRRQHILDLQRRLFGDD